MAHARQVPSAEEHRQQTAPSKTQGKDKMASVRDAYRTGTWIETWVDPEPPWVDAPADAAMVKALIVVVGVGAVRGGSGSEGKRSG